MTIKPLTPITPKPLGWFKREIDAFEKEINKRLVDDLSTCDLEFFYCYGNSYRKAIWIKVYNVNGKNVWLRIGFNDHDERKVNAYSECELDCLEWMPVTYALPTDFTKPGIWMTNKGERLHPMTWDEVIDQIKAMLNCLCTYKCKNGN